MKKKVILLFPIFLLIFSCYTTFNQKEASETEKTGTETSASTHSVPRIAVILPTLNNPGDPAVREAMIGVNRAAREYGGVIYGLNETVEYGGDAEFLIFQTDGGYGLEAAERIAETLRSFDLQSFDLIIGVGSQYGLPFYYINDSHQSRQFAVLDAVSFFGISNVFEIEFEIKDPAFIAGALAAERFAGDSLGVIGDLDCEFINNGFIEPFIDGVEYMDSLSGRYTDVIVEYPDDLYDNREVYRLASRLYKNGIRCIYQAAGIAGNGVLDAARDSRGLVIGCNLDQGLEAALKEQPYKHILTSTRKKWDNGIYLVCEEFLTTGSLPQTKQTVGLKEDCTDISINPYNTPVLGRQIETIRKLENALISGRDLPDDAYKIPNDRKDIWKSIAEQSAEDNLIISLNDPVLSNGIPGHYGSLLRDSLSTEFVRNGLYSIIDRNQVERLMAEIRFSMEAVSDDTRQLEVGRIAAADAIVFINLSRINERIHLDCKLVDVETGLTVEAFSETYPDLETMLDNTESVINAMTKQAR